MVHILDNGKRMRIRVPLDSSRERRPFPDEVEVIRKREDGEYDPPMIYVPRDGSDDK